MARFGLCGGSYQAESLNSDAQRTVNWIPTLNESGSGKSAMAMYPRGGLKLFASKAGANAGRGGFTIRNRTFQAIDAEVYEVLANGNLTALNAIANDLQMCGFAASPQQLVVLSAGILYVYQLQTSTDSAGVVHPAGQWNQIPVATFPNPVTQIGYDDGFFVALIANSEQFFVSNSFDALIWPAVSVKTINTFADNVVSFIVDHRELWLLGAKASEVDYDSGNFPLPFDTIPGGFIEQGCGAQRATVQLDNSIFWIGARSDQGSGIAWRANGYTPTRVSNHAVEFAWQTYSTIADAIGFTMQYLGHSFWVILFPSADKTWVYDVSTSLWHEWDFLSGGDGTFHAALPNSHTYNFGLHLMGDRQSGNIYQMNVPTVKGGGWDFVTDNDNLIRRLRRAPHISTENQWIRFKDLEIDVETGLGPQPPLRDGAGNIRDPQLMLRISRDAGHTYGNQHIINCGQAGEFKKRAVVRRLGRSRKSCVFELTATDPISWNIIDGYVDASPDFAKQPRLLKRAEAVA